MIMRREVVVAAAATTVATVVAGGLLLRHLKKRNEQRWKHTQRILRKLARDCATPIPSLWHVANDLVSDMQAGLSSDETILPMLPSYVDPLPTGDEKGLYYGLNLRGENFLILRARLGGKGEPVSVMKREEIPIPSDVLGGTSKEIFDYIVLHLVKFLSEDEVNVQNTDIILGFTVSFPVEEQAAALGTAIKWKIYSADDAVEFPSKLGIFMAKNVTTVGKELVKDMNQALKDHNMDARVIQLVDDTIGDLAGGRYYNRESVVAVTLGMGTNAAYVESIPSVIKWNGPTPKSGEIVIDMQWGNFSSSHFPLTEFDISLDAESSNPGCRMFEKLISGMYIGEIVRRVLLKMAKETALFGKSVPQKLTIPYSLRSPDMATMLQDTSEDREVVSEKLEEVFGISNSTPKAREVVAKVCDIVAERGARLAGAGIVGIIKKLERIANKRSVVTVEGGLYEHYRVFRNYLHTSVWEMLGNELSDNVIIEHSHGGSGAGAIFLAASQTSSQNSNS